MTITKKDMLDITAKLQMDIRDMNTKLTELRAWIAAAPLPEDDRAGMPCPQCDTIKRNELALADHLSNVHGNDQLRNDLVLRGVLE